MMATQRGEEQGNDNKGRETTRSSRKVNACGEGGRTDEEEAEKGDDNDNGEMTRKRGEMRKRREDEEQG